MRAYIQPTADGGAITVQETSLDDHQVPSGVVITLQDNEGNTIAAVQLSRLGGAQFFAVGLAFTKEAL